MKKILLIGYLIFSSALYAQTQMEMNESAQSNFQAADAKLNEIYQKIRFVYSDDPVFLKQLQAAQIAWIKFRDAQMSAVFPLTNNENPRFKYGSVYPMCYAYTLAALTEQRSTELETWLTGYEEGEVCAGSIKNSYEIQQKLTEYQSKKNETNAPTKKRKK
jgi:uncharacterized protein YecT (DUF1311 family)